MPILHSFGLVRSISIEVKGDRRLTAWFVLGHTIFFFFLSFTCRRGVCENIWRASETCNFLLSPVTMRHFEEFGKHFPWVKGIWIMLRLALRSIITAKIFEPSSELYSVRLILSSLNTKWWDTKQILTVSLNNIVIGKMFIGWRAKVCLEVHHSFLLTYITIYWSLECRQLLHVALCC